MSRQWLQVYIDCESNQVTVWNHSLKVHGENEGQMHFVQGEKIFRVCCQATRVTLNKMMEAW